MRSSTILVARFTHCMRARRLDAVNRGYHLEVLHLDGFFQFLSLSLSLSLSVYDDDDGDDNVWFLQPPLCTR